jgi:hypothetical protein
MVLTGGPCAGKTSCLRAIIEEFGNQVIPMPEVATLLLGSRFPPPGCETITVPAHEWSTAFQGAILSLQHEMERAYENLAEKCGARLIVCDRGVLDGAAYWSGGRRAFLDQFGLDVGACFARYQAVVHLESLATARPDDYGRAGNEIRFEELADAQERERAAREAWQGHPGWVFIPGRHEVGRTISEVFGVVRRLLSGPDLCSR